MRVFTNNLTQFVARKRSPSRKNMEEHWPMVSAGPDPVGIFEWSWPGSLDKWASCCIPSPRTIPQGTDSADWISQLARLSSCVLDISTITSDLSTIIRCDQPSDWEVFALPALGPSRSQLHISFSNGSTTQRRTDEALGTSL